MRTILFFVFAMVMLHVNAQQAGTMVITTTQGTIIKCSTVSMRNQWIYYTSANDSTFRIDSIDAGLIATITAESPTSKNAFSNAMFNRDGSNTLSAADKNYMDTKVRLAEELDLAKGKTILIAGATMFATSVALTVASTPFFLEGDDRGLGAIMTSFGGILFFPGIVMMPKGAMQINRAKVYHKQLGKYGGTEVAFKPSSIALPALGTYARGASILFTF
ncbi:MAG: hypothetical protein U0V74_17270 [Chitinophagales bacterium]